jgi:hypothetical protein
MGVQRRFHAHRTHAPDYTHRENALELRRDSQTALRSPAPLKTIGGEIA